MEPLMNMSERVCIVTGAARGIGLAICRLFAERNAKAVIGLDMDRAALEEAAQNIPNFRGEVVDVTDGGVVAAFAASVKEKYGTADVLVNNAGITRDALLQRMTEDEWGAVIQVNLTGVFNVTRAVFPLILEKGAGAVINIASVVGLDGNVGQSNYSATKAGVIGMTKTWAKEFARKGHPIRVNAVAPGFINTPMVEKVPDKIVEAMKEKTLFRRLGEPDEVARAVLFLASDESAFITGQVLRIDGGLTL